jgi:hypothetical protein
MFDFDVLSNAIAGQTVLSMAALVNRARGGMA